MGENVQTEILPGRSVKGEAVVRDFSVARRRPSQDFSAHFSWPVLTTQNP
jgi:hypothetical protein